jgi:uncharacterized protein YjbJ (UPF0337 family)
MKSSTKDQGQGTFHKFAGKVKELFGKASMNAELEGEGKNETRAGEAQKKVGEVEKVVGK